MTIDERLEKLVERHEYLTERHVALTQTVEMIALEHRQFALEQPQIMKDHQTLRVLVREMVAGIHDLTKIVRDHENRISKVEG